MPIEYTPQQRRAIFERGADLLVSAGAGSGKTAVLVQRVLELVAGEQPTTDIDRLLIVTFTKAAASEMRMKIQSALLSRADGDDPQALQRQLTLLPKASISTIHSFCAEVVRANFHLADVDPQFSVADEAAAQVLLTEALDETMERMYEDAAWSDAFYALLDEFGGGKDDSGLCRIVLDLYRFSQSMPDPERWLEEACESFRPAASAGVFDRPFGSFLREYVQEILKECGVLYRQALLQIEASEGLANYEPAFTEEAELINQALLAAASGTFDELAAAVHAVHFERLKPCARGAQEEAGAVKTLRAQVKDELADLSESLFYAPEAQLLTDMAAVYPRLLCLRQIVLNVADAFTQKKREKSLLDFNDLEHACIHLLTEEAEDGVRVPTKTAQQLREKYDYILIDEYQDSNFVQEAIFQSIKREDNLFLVGDVKQSIYRFRNAMPDLFLEKYRAWSGKAEGKQRKICLYQNFRSRTSVLDFVNHVFSNCMTRFVGETDYTRDEYLNPGASYEETGGDYRTEVRLVERDEAGEVRTMAVPSLQNGAGPGMEAGYPAAGALPPSSGPAFSMPNAAPEAMQMQVDAQRHSDSTGSSASFSSPEPGALSETAPAASKASRSPAEEQAIFVAERIRQLVEVERLPIRDADTGATRPVTYGDIVLLLRATKNKADVFYSALTAYGIPALSDGAAGFFEAPEVAVMLALLRVIDNPRVDIDLLAVLRSPLFSFEEQLLLDIRVYNRKGDYYDALSAAAEDIPQARAFLDTLHRWRALSVDTSADRLIAQIYADTGYDLYVGALKNGEARAANLRMLYRRAQQFESSSFKGLFYFNRYVQNMRDSEKGMAQSQPMRAADAVRILSIHKSKGLEFPVVFVVDCEKRFNRNELKQPVLMHHALYLAPDYVDVENGVRYPTIAKEAVRKKLLLESISEEMRILYVAMTRAKEKLILVGCVNNLQKAVEKWEQTGASSPLSKLSVLRASSFLDLIGPCLCRPDCPAVLLPARTTGREVPQSPPQPSVSPTAVHPTEFEPQGPPASPEAASCTRQNPAVQSGGEQALASGASDETAPGAASQLPEPDIPPERLAQLFSYQYPYLAAGRTQAKFSVTELYKLLFEDEAEFDMQSLHMIEKPQFITAEQELDAAARGSAAHKVLQHIDLYGVSDEAQVSAQISSLRERGLLTEEEAAVVEPSAIARFFASEVGRRMRAAQQVFREQRFSLRVPAQDLDQQALAGEFVCVQGVIDCFFLEEDGVVLLDYKTDMQKNANFYRKRYAPQLALYARAIEQLLCRSVHQQYIYSFALGEAIKL